MPAKLTLAEFLNKYLENIRGKKENTYATYVLAFSAFRRCLGDNTLLTDLNTLMVQDAVNELSTKVDKSTVKLYSNLVMAVRVE